MEYKFKVGDVVKLKQFPPIPKNNWSDVFTEKFNNIENKFIVSALGNWNFNYSHNRCIGFEEVDSWHPEDEFELYQQDIKFKKGDIVVCLPKPNKNPGNGEIKGGAGYASNLCFRASRVDDYPTYQVLFGGIDTNGVYSNSVRSATQEEIDEYNRLNKSYYITDISKPKFEVGKWYKGESNNKYIKVSKVEKCDGFNRIYYTERIRNGQFEIIFDYWASNSLEEFALNNPVDLSEIQKYLPDGHVDKIKQSKSLVGRYLKALVNRPNSGAVKAGEIGIITKELNGRPDFVDFPSQKCYLISVPTYDEGKSYQLIPEGFHPDQVKEEWVPKVGDWVITRGYSENYDGRALKITRIDNNKYYYFEVGDNGYYNSEHNFGKKHILRKAEPHEIPVESKQKSPNLDLLEEAKRRYPIGTRYRCASGGKYDESTVEEDTIWEFWDDECTKIDALGKYFVYYKGKWAEIVSSTESKLDVQGTPRPQFKIGDKVRVLSESHGWGDVEKGDIGVVKEVNFNFGSLLVDFPNQRFWEGKPECFELVEGDIEYEFKWEVKLAPIKDYSIQPLDYLTVEQSFDQPIKIKKVSNKRKLTIV